MRHFLILLLALSLFGCGTSPDAVNEAAETAARGSVPGDLTDWSAIAAQVGDVEVGWVAAYGDETLIALVEEAQSSNNNLIAAAANVDRARALAEQAGAAFAPNLNLTAGANRGGPVEGSSSGNLNAGLQTSWELDLWGRIASGRDASVNSLEAARADYRFSQESLAAGVVQAYFLLKEAVLQEHIAIERVEMVGEITRIVNAQFENGIGTQQDVSLAASDLAAARDSLAVSRASIRDAARALELFLGRYPSAEIEVATNLPDVPPMPPAGIPSDLLERRPDLIAAERRIAAAFNQTDVAKAARLPQVSLSGTIGGSSNQLSNLLNPSNIAWQAASSLLAPLFDNGLRQAQIDAATADQRAAIAAYTQAALQAFSDTEQALDTTLLLTERRQLLEESAEEAREALRIAQLRYETGETDLVSVLSIQQRVIGAESTLISVLRAQLTNYASLNLALGGSWTD